MEPHPEHIGQPARRRSRVHRASSGATILLGRRDLAIFRLLERYRYLPSNFIHAFVGGNLTCFKQRLGTLFHEGYLDRPLAQWKNANARYRPAVYQLADKAKAALAEHGFAALHHNAGGGSFAHELMVAEIMASFELASR
jgi:hypothetical protein